MRQLRAAKAAKERNAARLRQQALAFDAEVEELADEVEAEQEAAHPGRLDALSFGRALQDAAAGRPAPLHLEGMGRPRTLREMRLERAAKGKSESEDSSQRG
jgi:hypothetical protein